VVLLHLYPISEIKLLIVMVASSSNISEVAEVLELRIEKETLNKSFIEQKHKYIYDVDSIKDLVVYRRKDKLLSKKLKASNEDKSNGSNKKTQIVFYNDVDIDHSEIKANRCKYRLCYKKDHYAPRCSNKKNEQIDSSKEVFRL
ncbi:35749_t:CDS:2, partial [Racocetra persica]